MTAIDPGAAALPGEELVTVAEKKPKKSKAGNVAARKSAWASVVAAVIAILWTIPTLGLLITSFRPGADVRRTGWWTFFTNPSVTLENYKDALFGGTTNLSDFFVNSLVITIPAVIIPISLACMAAYAFSWLKFPASRLLFIVVFALQIVPIQVTMIPLLTMFVRTGLNGSFWPIWIAHTMFGLPLAIFLMHNFMRELPSELVEAARVDGAGPLTIFFSLLS